MNIRLPCTGGAITPWSVPDTDKSKGKWQITMNGRATGEITLNVKAINSTEWEPIQGKTTINPATELTLIFTGMVQELRVDDTGNVGDFVLIITSVGLSQ